MTEKPAVNTYDTYETDPDAEENGAWVQMRPGLRYRIRSELCKTVRQFDHNLLKTQRALYVANNGILPLELQDRNEVLRASRAILSDWDGQTDREGNPLPFSPENAERVMTDLQRLRNDVLLASRTEETFRKEMQKVLEGNLVNTSPKS